MKTMKTEKKTISVEVDVPVMETNNVGPYDRFLGKYCYVSCCNYAYAGIVSGVNGSVFEITNPELVYETGSWSNAPNWQNSQKLPTDLLTISTNSIEVMFEVSR